MDGRPAQPETGANDPPATLAELKSRNAAVSHDVGNVLSFWLEAREALAMKRRAFITLLGGAAAWPLAALAQISPKRRPLIAWLSGGISKGLSGAYPANFLEGMREFGYAEGSDFEMVYRFAEGISDRLQVLAEEVVQLKPDVILASAMSAAVPAFKATSTIPIVCPFLADAVQLGLIASEARPGGNITGVEPYVAGLPAKQMELAREIAPHARKVGLLTNLQDPKVPPQLRELKTAAAALEVTIVEAEVNRPGEVEGAVEALASQRVDVVIVLQSTLLLVLNGPIAKLALEKRLPTVYGYREHVEAGGLISYGVNVPSCYRRSAYFVHRILKGERPGDLPIEFPSKIELVINLKTAKALGLTVPPTLLVRADEVIE
jgi:putative ABC transport system substrate-binding protein